jgi:hypothetical protein
MAEVTQDVSPASAFETLLTELEAKHKRIGIVTHPDTKSWIVVLRKPTRAEYKMFRSNSNNAQKASDAQEILCRSIVVYPPSKEQFDALLEDWPGIPEACGKTIIELAGMSGQEQGKS